MMTKPDFAIRETELTVGGALRSSDLRNIRSKLMAQGLVLFPSDTCYRLGLYAAYGESVELLRSILSTQYSDIHLTAPNFEALLKWFDSSNRSSTSILERLTPGPITVVCEPSRYALDSSQSIELLAMKNEGSVGFRVPDSFVERDIASTNENYLIASTPIVGKESGVHISEFEEALSIVQENISRVGRIGWCAVEGRINWSGRVSVVEVAVTGEVNVLQEGIVASDTIDASAAMISSTSFDDWG